MELDKPLKDEWALPRQRRIELQSQPASKRTKRTVFWTLTALAVGLTFVAPAGAGTIKGKVRFVGTIQAPETVTIEQDTQACGTSKDTGSIKTGAEQGLQWAVVQVAGLNGASADAEPPELDQNGCEFVPRVVIARPGEVMAVLNSDGILHNVHTYSEENPVMNLAMPGFVPTMPLKFDHAETIKVTCDVHGWMTGWIFVSDRQHAAVTDENGSFTLEGVPAGTRQLTVWHEELGEQTQDVTVQDGQETSVTFEFAGR